jgi:ABC-2 type transport system ATP-binding protein
VIELREPLDAVPEALAQHGLERARRAPADYTYDTRGERTGITRLLADVQAKRGSCCATWRRADSSLEEIFVDLVAADMEDAA